MILFVFNYDIASDKSFKDFYLTYIQQLCKKLPEKESFKLNNHSKLPSLELIKAECKLLPKSRTTREPFTTLAVLGISVGVTLLSSGLHVLWEIYQQTELKEGMKKLADVTKKLDEQTQALGSYTKKLGDLIFLLQNFHDMHLLCLTLIYFIIIMFDIDMLLILPIHT